MPERSQMCVAIFIGTYGRVSSPVIKELILSFQVEKEIKEIYPETYSDIHACCVNQHSTHFKPQSSIMITMWIG